jgi:multiple sugar transport system substrate-binding protein
MSARPRCLERLRRFRNLGLALLIGPGFTVACGGRDSGAVTLKVWGLGREGEVLRDLLPAFEQQHPGIHVRVQQIPWTAAHEKLLTAFVGDATPDVAQIGNTWLPEFVALGALAPFDSTVVDRHDYFPGIWETNVIGGQLYGVPWYVDTRLIFYRSDLLAKAGYAQFPTDWTNWRQAMMRLHTSSAILLALNEWAGPIVLGMGEQAPFLTPDGLHGDFEEPRFRRAFSFYVDLFRDKLAPAVSAAQVANRYQSFANGEFAMLLSGPWDIGELSRRLPPSLNGKWMTAPMPAPDAPGTGLSLAGGSSLCVFRRSEHQAAAQALIAYLSEPAVQLKFYTLTGDLPARQSAWSDPLLDTNRYAAAFRAQLQHVVPTPKVPEWEQIVTSVARYAEETVRGGMSEDAALAALDRDVDQMLDKRRWLATRLATHVH